MFRNDEGKKMFEVSNEVWKREEYGAQERPLFCWFFDERRGIDCLGNCA